MKRFNDTPVSDFSYSDEPASLRDLENRESRECAESAFSLQSEDTREALDDLRLGWGESHLAGETWENDDSEYIGDGDYVPAWA